MFRGSRFREQFGTSSYRAKLSEFLCFKEREMNKSLWRLAPPLLSDWYQTRVPRRRQFRTHADAVRYCGEAGYQDAEVIDVVIEKNKQLREQHLPEMMISASDQLIALAVACAVNRNPATRVVDYGGGGGSHYFSTRRIVELPPQLRWHVIETPLMAERAAALSDETLSFADCLATAVEALGGVDLVIASGVLHCCDNPLAVLAELLSARPAHVLLTRSLNPDLDFTAFVAQESMLSSNGPGQLPSKFKDRTVRYPNHIVPHSQLEQLLLVDYETILLERGSSPHLRLKTGTASFYSHYVQRRTQ